MVEVGYAARKEELSVEAAKPLWEGCLGGIFGKDVLLPT